MARKNKKKECDHRFMQWSWTFTSWHDAGRAYKAHRACYKCSKMEWSRSLETEKELSAFLELQKKLES